MGLEHFLDHDTLLANLYRQCTTPSVVDITPNTIWQSQKCKRHHLRLQFLIGKKLSSLALAPLQR